MAEEHRNIRVSVSGMTFVKLFVLGIVVYALFYLRDLILVVLTAIVIASFVGSAVSPLNHKPMLRNLAVVLMYLCSLVALALSFYFFAPIFLSEVSNVWPMLAPFVSHTGILKSFDPGLVSGAGEFAGNFAGYSSFGDFANGAGDFLASSSVGFLKALSAVFGGLLNVALIFIISFYLSIEKKGIENFLRVVIPPKQEDYAVDLWHRSQKKIALWIRGQFLLGLIVGVLMFIGLSILQVPYALLLSLLVVLAELIPFGVTLAAIPAVFLAYGEGGATLGLFVAGLYLVVQKFENYFIQPYVIKKVVGISPLVVILSVLAGAHLAGFWGILLAIPVVVPLLEMAEDIEKKKLFAKSGE